MLYVKINFWTDGSATVYTSDEKTHVRDGQHWRPKTPWFIEDLKGALELELIHDNTKITVPGFPPTTVGELRKAWDF